MEASVFKMALAAITSGEYCESDVKTLKEHLNQLNKQEISLKRKIEKETNNFVKNKDKNQTELKTLRKDIKSIKNILKKI